MYACMLSHFNRVWLCATLWTVALQDPLFMGFSRQDHWSGLPYSPPGDLADPGTEPVSLTAGGFFTASATWEALNSNLPSCYLFSICLVWRLFSLFCLLLGFTSNTRKEETFLRKPSGFHFQQICGTNTWELIGYLMLCLPRVDMHCFLGPWCSGSVKST